MSFEETANAKAELRKAIREARRELTDEQRDLSARQVARRLLELPAFAEGRGGTVLAYMPMRYELSVVPAVHALRERGFRIAYPLCTEGNGLRLLVPPAENGFIVGAYGIMEPREEASREVDASELSAIILPAIGFDREFNRLGQGGGYYDRLLAKTSCFTVAVGFDCQLADHVPTEPTDKKVDAVVTPSFTAVR